MFATDGCNTCFLAKCQDDHRANECVTKRLVCAFDWIGCRFTGTRDEMKTHMSNVSQHLSMAVTTIKLQRGLMVADTFRLQSMLVPAERPTLLIREGFRIRLEELVDVWNGHNRWVTGFIREFPAPNLVRVIGLEDGISYNIMLPIDADKLLPVGSAVDVDADVTKMNVANVAAKFVAIVDGVSMDLPLAGLYWRAGIVGDVGDECNWRYGHLVDVYFNQRWQTGWFVQSKAHVAIFRPLVGDNIVRLKEWTNVLAAPAFSYVVPTVAFTKDMWIWPGMLVKVAKHGLAVVLCVSEGYAGVKIQLITSKVTDTDDRWLNSQEMVQQLELPSTDLCVTNDSDDVLLISVMSSWQKAVSLAQSVYHRAFSAGWQPVPPSKKNHSSSSSSKLVPTSLQVNPFSFTQAIIDIDMSSPKKSSKKKKQASEEDDHDAQKSDAEASDHSDHSDHDDEEDEVKETKSSNKKRSASKPSKGKASSKSSGKASGNKASSGKATAKRASSAKGGKKKKETEKKKSGKKRKAAASDSEGEDSDEGESGKKRSRRSKKKKRDGPKKPTAAPIWYFKEHQAAYKAAHPTTKQCDIMAILIRDEWSKIKETDAAKPYFEKAAQDKARYERELEAYHKANGTVPKPKSKKPKVEKTTATNTPAAVTTTPPVAAAPVAEAEPATVVVANPTEPIAATA
jgi:hypothetical protein